MESSIDYYNHSPNIFYIPNAVYCSIPDSKAPLSDWNVHLTSIYSIVFSEETESSWYILSDCCYKSTSTGGITISRPKWSLHYLFHQISRIHIVCLLWTLIHCRSSIASHSRSMNTLVLSNSVDSTDTCIAVIQCSRLPMLPTVHLVSSLSHCCLKATEETVCNYWYIPFSYKSSRTVGCCIPTWIDRLHHTSIYWNRRKREICSGCTISLQNHQYAFTSWSIQSSFYRKWWYLPIESSSALRTSCDCTNRIWFSHWSTYCSI